MLLGRFLDMGPWAVDLVGSFGFAVVMIYFLLFHFICTGVYSFIVFFFNPEKGYSMASDSMMHLMKYLLLGLVSWNISMCSKAVANNYSGTTADSRVYLDKDPSP